MRNRAGGMQPGGRQAASGATRSALFALVLAAGCYATDPNAPGELFDDGRATMGSRSAPTVAPGAPIVDDFNTAPTMPLLPTPSVTPTAPPPPPLPPPTDPGLEPFVDPEDDAGLDLGPLDHDLGRPCDPTAPEGCQWDTCYVPGATDNPICSKLCANNSECPADAECVFPGNCGGSQNDCGGLGYCFVRCESDAFCAAINDTPVNALECVMHPKYDFGQEVVDVCIESSEP